MSGRVAACGDQALGRRDKGSGGVDLQYPDVEQHLPHVESPQSQSWFAGPQVPS